MTYVYTYMHVSMYVYLCNFQLVWLTNYIMYMCVLTCAVVIAPSGKVMGKSRKNHIPRVGDFNEVTMTSLQSCVCQNMPEGMYCLSV